jgi:hypothetical protein
MVLRYFLLDGSVFLAASSHHKMNVYFGNSKGYLPRNEARYPKKHNIIIIFEL